jgi:diguanylate cyclase (GGDEF)-like protein
MNIEDGILEHITNEVYIFDINTFKFIYINKSAQINLGYSKKEIKKFTADKLNLKVSKENFTKSVGLPLINNEVNSILLSTTLQRKDKTCYEVELSLLKTVYEGRVAYVAIALDLTEQINMKKTLASQAETLRKLTHYVPGTLYQFKLYPDGRSSFPYASENIYDLYEVNAESLMQNAIEGFARHHPDDEKRIYDTIQKSAQTMDEWSCEYRVNLPNKGLRWLEGHSTPEKLADDSVLWHGYLMDITERKATEKLLLKQQTVLQQQAYYDSLTGLANRRLLLDRLGKAIQKSTRHTSKLALLFIDLDNFKEINDSLGHDAGDKVLIEITSILTAIIRSEDTMARLGGDEFTILLENITNTESVATVCNKILQKLAHPIKIDGSELYISCSIGISLFPDDGIKVHDLLKYADSAMYKAKREGKNNFQFYDTKLTELATERVIMETGLRLAIKNKELEVYYQPQVDGRTDKLIGIEALIRWNHPTMGFVPPAKFIPLAEVTSLIIDLDRFVMEQAMTQVAHWYEKGLNPGVLALNLSVKQIQQKNCISYIQLLMKKIKFKPYWLELEVTEGQIMTNPKKAIKTLQKIRNLGIDLAIDDFGTGYSSLSYLKKLPINKLKIDREFIKNLPESKDDAAITQGIIILTKILNLDVIAEGVETEEQKNFLIEGGCNAIQGYLYSKPVTAVELEVILQNGCRIQSNSS